MIKQQFAKLLIFIYKLREMLGVMRLDDHAKSTNDRTNRQTARPTTKYSIVTDEGAES